ncbi:MAG: family 78 glycoside hydrolase catalytic domain [Bacteroidia bacterium]|nr:family 78 glycoside hydrolase catalytic domain [Bacteroidia bacterium]
MKNRLKFFSLAVLAFLCMTGAKDTEPRIPYGLMVEFIREPENVKIFDLTPELSWIVPARAKRQSAFQILISSNRENIENNKGDIWDSGKVTFHNPPDHEIGVMLKGNSTYFWKVRIWNWKDKPTQFSEIQSFKTGSVKNYATTQNRFLSTLKSPEKILKIADNHYFIDFGKDAFGTLVLEITPLKKDTIIVHFGEMISAANQVDRNPGGSIRYQKVRLAVAPGKTDYILTLPPDTRNTGGAAIHLPDSFGVVTPFRYCELENCSFDNNSGNIFQKAFTYYFDDKASSFTSSDTILNQVWDLCKYSVKATLFTGIYIDGDRERIPYEADAYINQLGHYYTDREYSAGRVTNEYFIKHPTWPTEWILQTVPMFYNDIMFTGNLESAAEYYKELKYKTLTALARDDGLISSKNVNDDIMKSLGFSNPKERIRDIVDWPPAQKDTGWKLAGPDGERDGYEMVEINTVVNAFYYHNLVLIAEIALMLDKTDDAYYYNTFSEKVRKSFNEKLLDESKGIYVDGENSEHSSLHANMMALAFDLVPEKYLKSVIAFIKSRGMACSVYGAQYLLEGLYKSGEGDYAYSLLTSTSDRSWWNMIRSGSTIAMEAWDMKYKPNSDWNHAWGAAPANIIPGYLWGITPAVPGFGRFVIKPQLGNLGYSKIEVPTIRGTIVAEFRDKGKSKEYFITVPGDTECDFEVSGELTYRLGAGLNKIVLRK